MGDSQEARELWRHESFLLPKFQQMRFLDACFATSECWRPSREKRMYDCEKDKVKLGSK